MKSVKKENLKAQNNKQKSIFWTILSQYLCESQVHGYNLIMLNNRPLYERLFWITVTVFGILLTFWLVLNSYFDFLQQPTVTSEDPIHVSVLELPFPAVSICSANRISQRALINYSQFILNATKEHTEHIGRTVGDIFNNLVRMGQMYSMELFSEDSSRLERIHTVLTNVYGGPYPIYEILSNLTPSCNDLLKNCKWHGRSVLCSEIFIKRRSFMGPCCSFNNQRPWVSTMKEQQKFNQTIRLNQPYKVHSHGSNFGLVALINHNVDDYAFTMNSYIGVNVLIHDTYTYPDQASGAVNENIVSPGEEVFMTLHPIPMEGSRSMKTFTIDSRNCVFDDEINLVFANFYSLSECLFTCRMNNIIRFCGCSPSQFNNLFNSTACMLNDMQCLNRWRLVWYNFEPLATNVDRDFEINDIHCPECVPKCNRIEYAVQVSESNFDPSATYDSDFINVTDVANYSVLYINFGTNKVTSFKQTAQYEWYELLANLGAVGCLTLGATMVSIIEIFYFFSGKFGGLWKTEKEKKFRRPTFDYVN